MSNVCSNVSTVNLVTDNPSMPRRNLLAQSRPERRSIRAVTDALRHTGVAGEVHLLPDSARTAAQAAAALRCEIGAIANSLVFDAGGEPLLILTSGSHRVDTRKVATEQHLAELRRASPGFVRAHTGQAIGGVSPVGHPVPLRTFVDTELARHRVVWAAAGHPHCVFPTSYAELLKVTGAQPAEVGD